MFDTILVALDTDEDCGTVFEQALNIAKPLSAELELLHVLTPASDDALAWTAYYPGIVGYSATVSGEIWQDYQQRYETYKKRGKAVLQRLVDQALESGVVANFSQRENPAGLTICSRAKEIHADLIVVGSHGRKGLSEMLIGSVSNYVMHHAYCSVMVVHPQHRTEIDSTISEASVVA